MNGEYSREEQKKIKIGLCVSILLLVLTFFYTDDRRPVEHQEIGKFYSVYARFGRTDGLQVGDHVRMAGMTVGSVSEAKLDDKYNAVLTLKLKEGINIPDDSSASIVSDGILGSKYIEIEPGGSEDFITEGNEFSYTQDAMVLEELIERVISMAKAKKAQKTKE